jgi:hypothetical protein
VLLIVGDSYPELLYTVGLKLGNGSGIGNGIGRAHNPYSLSKPSTAPPQYDIYKPEGGLVHQILCLSIKIQTAVHIGWPSEARIFAVDRSPFSICRWRSTIRMSSVGINRVTIIFVCGTSFHLYSLHFVLNKNELPPLGTGSFPFVVRGLVSIICCS